MSAKIPLKALLIAFWARFFGSHLQELQYRSYQRFRTQHSHIASERDWEKEQRLDKLLKLH